ncbi:hypothetical protein KY285_013262 [Solanum tuberosum]|nr:hypothetical protein KY285_013262 [Solanum tuberosum]
MTKLNDNTRKGDTYRPNDKRKKRKVHRASSSAGVGLWVVSPLCCCRSWHGVGSVRWQWRGEGIVRVLGVCLVVKEVGKDRGFEWFSGGFEENEGEVLGDFFGGVLVGGVM